MVLIFCESLKTILLARFQLELYKREKCVINILKSCGLLQNSMMLRKCQESKMFIYFLLSFYIKTKLSKLQNHGGYRG